MIFAYNINSEALDVTNLKLNYYGRIKKAYWAIIRFVTFVRGN